MRAIADVPTMQVAVVIPAFRADAHIAGVLRGIPDYVAGSSSSTIAARTTTGADRRSGRRAAIRASGCCGTRSIKGSAGRCSPATTRPAAWAPRSS